MTKFYAVAAAALAGMGSVAMAQTSTPTGATGQINNTTAAVPVTVAMSEVVSVWTDFTPVVLTVGQSDGNGFAGEARSLSYINNAVATISVKVDGSLPDVPDGANFFIFPNQSSVATAQAAQSPNAYAPTGALVWTNAGAGNMGSTQIFAEDLAIDTDGGSIPLVYAANIPGGISSPPEDYALVVTYTIAAATP